MGNPPSEKDASEAVDPAFLFDQQRVYLGIMRDEQGAWAEFYNYFKGRLDKYFERKGVYLLQDRDDLLQETMAAVLIAIHSYEPERCSLKNWVYAVAEKVMRRGQRKYSAQYAHEQDGYGALTGIHSDINGIDESRSEQRKVSLEALKNALENLSEADQQILKLRSERDEHETLWADIGRELGIGTSAVKMRYQRALKRLKKAMDIVVASSHP